MKRIIKYALLPIFIFAAIFLFFKIYENNENERKLEARFDKFAGYFYPHLKEISEASNIYKRMQISLMYDYLEQKKGRFAYETVRYYDGGVFLVKDHINIMFFLQNSTNKLTFKTSYILNTAPVSRHKERNAIFKIINSARALTKVDIYIDDYDIQSVAAGTKETFDSLVSEIQGNLYLLSKYKNKKDKLDLSQIKDSDYDLNNY